MGEWRQEQAKRWERDHAGFAPTRTRIHGAAFVERGASIHETAVIGAGAVIGPHVRIGPRVKIGPHAVVTGDTELGADVRVHAGAVIGDEPQDNAYRDARSYVRVGPRARIREYVTIHRGTQPGSETVIGADCFLMASSHVAHNCRLDDGVTLANGALLAGHVLVGAGAFVSGNAVVHQFVRIGRRAMIAGGTRATRDVPPFSMVLNDRLTGLNLIGMRRGRVERSAQVEMRRLYDFLANRNKPLEQCLNELRGSVESALCREYLDFLANPSKRGIMPFDART